MQQKLEACASSNRDHFFSFDPLGVDLMKGVSLFKSLHIYEYQVARPSSSSNLVIAEKDAIEHLFAELVNSSLVLVRARLVLYQSSKRVNGASEIFFEPQFVRRSNDLLSLAILLVSC